MRRDLTYYYEKDIKTVFDGIYRACASKFSKSVTREEFHTISVRLGFSFKYNMNGGALTVHLMPYKNGTAVDYRYSIVQAVGARCETHANDVNKVVSSLIGAAAIKVDIGIDTFLESRTEQVTSGTIIKQSSTDDLTEKLKKLKELYDQGLITKQDYESKKSQLLNCI